MTEHTGQCLCGAVKLTIAQDIRVTTACHCNMCRRWAGGPFFAVDVGQSISLSGVDNISIFSSSDWAERGFCKKCGTNLYYRLIENNEFHVSVGVLDELSKLKLTTEYFIDEKPGLYDFANDCQKLTGEELFAMYAPTDEK